MKGKKKVSVCFVIIKSVFVLFMVWTMVTISVHALKSVAEYTDYTYNEAERVKQLDRYYYDGDYASLWKTLLMWRMYDEKYDLYREAADGFTDYQNYLQYKKASDNGMQKAREPAGKFRLKVLENAENCRFESNRKQLEEYARKIP